MWSVLWAGKQSKSVEKRSGRCGMPIATAVVMPKTRVFSPPSLFRSILCPVDFSEHSAEALRYAAVLAKRSAGRLHVLYVNDPMLVSAAAIAFADPNYVKTSLSELRRFVAKALAPGAMKAISIRYAVDKGEPARLIASVAQKFGCDLIVMGTHGLSGVDKILVGSTTERLIRRASLPVLAIPPSPGLGIGAQPSVPRWPGTAILVPVDLRGESARDVRDAEQIARAFGTSLLLIHVVPPVQQPPWFRADLSAYRRMQVTRAERQLESLASTVGRGVDFETRVMTGPPADEIAAVASEERIGLVVMRRRRGPGWFGSRAGSIAARVLRHAVTPVLVLPGLAKRHRQVKRERLRASA